MTLMKNNRLLRILLVKKLFLIFLFLGGMYNCTVTASGSGDMPKEFGIVPGVDDKFDEIVLLCGNPGVGKSTLCNSIFGQAIFRSGGTFGTGVTVHGQGHLHEGRLYMDTPGLDDAKTRDQAALEIEKALKQNKGCKIVFVIKPNAGRIQGTDMVTINVVCDAIKTSFEYGLVFNQVPKKSIKKIEGSEKNQAMIAESLKLLHKQPVSVEVLTLNEDLVDEDNLFLDSRDANRVKLVQFIKNLKANKIEAKNTDGGFDEIVLLCGNPGVGKSTLCNSIFGQGVFKSGVSLGTGLTTCGQGHIHEGIFYMDTPGLDDVKTRDQAALEIEKALKQDKDYKILFVATLETGRIKPADLQTMNIVCDTVKTDFTYGIVFNKVTNPVMKLIEATEDKDKEIFNVYLTALHKKPSSFVILPFDRDMHDEEDLYFKEKSENRTKLLQFIKNLKANKIETKNVEKVDVKDHDKKLEEMKEIFKAQANAMREQHEQRMRSMQEIMERQSRAIYATRSKSPEIRYVRRDDGCYIG
jgi:predicted GTPase